MNALPRRPPVSTFGLVALLTQMFNLNITLPGGGVHAVLFLAALLALLCPAAITACWLLLLLVVVVVVVELAASALL